jgi:hypothetical protein
MQLHSAHSSLSKIRHNISYSVLFIVHLVRAGLVHASQNKLLLVQPFNFVITKKLHFYAVKGLSLRDYGQGRL